LVYEYIGVTEYGNYMFIVPIYSVFKHSSYFSSIDITPMAHFVCCLWNSLGQVGWSGCVASGFVVGVCAVA
jgi:hypothetical protein